jgi:glutamate-5-semialdehyde dehydrogenase
MDYKEIARNVKADSFVMGSLPNEKRIAALASIGEALEARKEDIFAANKKDLAAGENLPTPVLERLKFDDHKLADCIEGIKNLQNLPDPLFKVLLERELDANLTLTKITCPIGVIGVIFESRPDALVQISALCIRSGNCAILKGGSEAKNTNKLLFEIIYEAGRTAGLPEGFAALIEDRSGIDALLGCHDSIDLIIPRGSNEFVQYIMANSKIPVMGHADGICHIYVDKSADLDVAIPIIVDAKTQYVAACNTVETLLIHKDIAKEVLDRLQAYDKIELRPAKDESDYKEYLDYILTTKEVSGLDEAIAHINCYGSHHTDCIIAQDRVAIEKFMSFVDSAGVYSNCSTRFADGFRYGFGAEVGISTGKLHARGPVGLDGLVTYKYKLHGDGQIVADYASGKKQFHYKDSI